MELEAIKGYKILLVEALTAAKEAGDISSYSLLNGSLLAINILEKENKKLEKEVEALKARLENGQR